MHDKSFDVKVFISYSRKDGLEFVDQLAAALEVVGVHPIIDRHSISGGEDWRERINSLIAEADSVVFAITPESVASEVCEWEIDKSDQLAKRIIPVISAPLEGVSLPERLRNLNHIFFYHDVSIPRSGFGSGLAKLSKVLRADINWIHAQTRYGQRATEWLAGNRASNRLLSGSDITTAKTWIAERQPSAPEITDEMREFIDASEQADNELRNIEQKRLKEKEETLIKIEKAQGRAKRFLIGGVVFSAALAMFASWMWLQADRSERSAKGLLDLVGWIGNRKLDGVRKPTEEQKHSMIELCNHAIGTTKRIGNNLNSNDTKNDIDQFWALYKGPLYVVEQFERYYFPDKQIMIESTMVDFGEILKGKREGSLMDAANRVKNACEKFEKLLTDSNFDQLR